MLQIIFKKTEKSSYTNPPPVYLAILQNVKLLVCNYPILLQVTLTNTMFTNVWFTRELFPEFGDETSH